MHEALAELSKREQVNTIQGQYLDTPNFVLDSIDAGVDYIREIFNKQHFAVEMLQNAADAGATAIAFDIETNDNRLRIYDDGHGLQFNDVLSLAALGKTSKESTDDTTGGGAGIGVLSCFELADTMEVHSNGYHIRFRKDGIPTDTDQRLPPVAPEWVGSDPPTTPYKRPNDPREYTTLIDLSLTADASPSDVLSAPNISIVDLLFLQNSVLKNIETIYVDGPMMNRTLSITASSPTTQDDSFADVFTQRVHDASPENGSVKDVTVERLETEENGSLEEWLSFSITWVVPESVPRPLHRKGQETIELIALLGCSPNGYPTTVPARGAIRLSSREMYQPPVHIGYYLGAEFATYPDRKTLRADHPWNNHVAAALRYLCLKPLIKSVQADEEGDIDASTLVPSVSKNTDFVTETVFEPLRETTEISHE